MPITRKRTPPPSGTVKLIDISDKPVEATVTRDGRKVPQVEFHEELVLDFVARDVLDEPRQQPRVVYQSVKNGTRVPRGTAVDLVLTDPFLVDAGLVAGSHEGLKERPFAEVLRIFVPDEQTKREVQGAEKAEDLSPETRSIIEQKATENDIRIDERRDDQSFEALFKTIQASVAFS